MLVFWSCIFFLEVCRNANNEGGFLYTPPLALKILLETLLEKVVFSASERDKLNKLYEWLILPFFKENESDKSESDDPKRFSKFSRYP